MEKIASIIKSPVAECAKNNLKPGFLFLARKRIDHIIIEAIEELKPDFTIIVICGKDELEVYSKIKEIVTVSDISIDDAINFRKNNSVEDILSKLEWIEKNLAISSFETISNYILYDVFVSRYADIPKQHALMKEYLSEINILSYQLLIELIKKYDIQYSYYETIDLPISYLIHAISKKDSLVAYEFRWLPLLNLHRIRIATDLSRKSRSIERIYKNESYSAAAYAQAELMLSNAQSTQQSFYGAVNKLTVIDRLKRVNVRRLGFRQVKSFITKWLNTRRAKKYFSNDLASGKFILVFLQHTPEASMCSQAPLYVNQQVFIQQLAINAKAGYMIVVKEHPRTLGNREEMFYADLKNLPNVCILPPYFDNDLLISKAEAIVAVTTTTPVLSALLKNKFVFMFSETFVDFFDNVIRIDSISEFWGRLLELKNESPSKEAVKKFLAACLEGSYDFPIGSKGNIFPKLGGGIVLARALMDQIKSINYH